MCFDHRSPTSRVPQGVTGRLYELLACNGNAVIFGFCQRSRPIGREKAVATTATTAQRTVALTIMYELPDPRLASAFGVEATLERKQAVVAPANTTPQMEALVAVPLSPSCAFEQ